MPNDECRINNECQMIEWPIRTRAGVHDPNNIDGRFRIRHLTFRYSSLNRHSSFLGPGAAHHYGLWYERRGDTKKISRYAKRGDRK